MRFVKWLVAAAAMANCQSPWAAETQLTADAAKNLEYNDNVRLTRGSKEHDWIQYLSANAAWTASRPDGSLYLGPAARFRRYTTDTVLNSDDYSLDAAAERDFERSALQLQGNYSRSAIQSDEFNGIGIIQVGATRRQWMANPKWSIDLSPDTTGTISLSHTDVGYDGRAPSLVDYDTSSASASVTREFSEDDSLGATASASRLGAPAIRNRVDQAGLQFVYDRTLSESVEFSGTVGAQRNWYLQAFAPHRSDTGFVFGLTLKGEREYGNWELDINRSVDPSGTGTVMRSDTATISRSVNWTPSLSSNFMLLISNRKDLQGLNPGNDSRYGQGQASLGWEMRENWKLSIEYRIVGQRLRALDATATGNAVLLWLSYHADIKPASQR